MATNFDTLGLSATVTAQGISAPDYQTILGQLMDSFRQIYGSDAYLEADSKDGQLISLVALAIHDANNAAIAVYNSFSPATAVGNGLSRNVKINGLVRKLASHSMADVVLIGEIGTSIIQGRVRDTSGTLWNLPDTVTIGIDGTATETVFSQAEGSLCAQSGSINQIATPTRGWFSVSNPQAAMPGKPVETDAELRQRQSESVALPSMTTFEGLLGAIASVEGVTRYKLYENDSGIINGNGLPPHSIAAIVAGGDGEDIANVIYLKKGQGTSTYGSTNIVVSDYYGNPKNIQFSRPVNVPVFIDIAVKVTSGYTENISNEIKINLVNYINEIAIGDDVILSRLYSPANAGEISGGESKYYDIYQMNIGRSPGSVAAANIYLAFDETAFCSIGNINITVS